MKTSALNFQSMLSAVLGSAEDSGAVMKNQDAVPTGRWRDLEKILPRTQYTENSACASQPLPAVSEVDCFYFGIRQSKTSSARRERRFHRNKCGSLRPFYAASLDVGGHGKVG